MIKTRILKVKGDWQEVLNDCRFTANKADLYKTPSDKFKKRVLISEHSPIRGIIFKWEWNELPHWAIVHWVRHKWEKYVQTQRPDRTGNSRPSQDDPQSMRGEANVQSLIDTMRKRLCFKASDKTRESANSLKIEIHDKYDKHIADVFVPNCIYRCGCPEYNKDDPNRCKFFEWFKERAEDSDVDITDIEARYKHYNRLFYLNNSYEEEEE